MLKNELHPGMKIRNLDPRSNGDIETIVGLLHDEGEVFAMYRAGKRIIKIRIDRIHPAGVKAPKNSWQVMP